MNETVLTHVIDDILDDIKTAWISPNTLKDMFTKYAYDVHKLDSLLSMYTNFIECCEYRSYDYNKQELTNIGNDISMMIGYKPAITLILNLKG